MVIGQYLNGFIQDDIDDLEDKGVRKNSDDLNLQCVDVSANAHINFSQVGSQNSEDFKWQCDDVSAITLFNVFKVGIKISGAPKNIVHVLCLIYLQVLLQSN